MRAIDEDDDLPVVMDIAPVAGVPQAGPVDLSIGEEVAGIVDDPGVLAMAGHGGVDGGDDGKIFRDQLIDFFRDALFVLDEARQGPFDLG